MKDIICECGHEATEHIDFAACDIVGCACQLSASEVYLAHIAKLEAVVEAAKDVNDWLIRTERKDTAHQKHLASTLAALEE